MYELSQILLWILWRLRPAMAVETNLVDILEEAIRLFESEDGRAWMREDVRNCALVSQGLLDARSKLDLLIYLRACEIAGVPHRARAWRPTKLLHHSDRTLADCWRRFLDLAARFHDAERLAQLRAVKLRSEHDEALPSCLVEALQSTSAMLRAVNVSMLTREVLHRLWRRGQRAALTIARPCAQDGGGRATARGPPNFNFPESSPDRLAA